MTTLLDIVRPHGWLPLVALLAVNCMVCYRFAGRGFFVMIIVTGITYALLDNAWVDREMSRPDWDGTPDRDAIFLLGSFLRVLSISAMMFVSFALTLFVADRLHSPRSGDVSQNGG